MKLSIHAILYLLCASVVSGQYAEATERQVVNKYGQEVNMSSFVKKCRHVVESIWMGTHRHEDRANFEEDLLDALAYVEYYTREQHQIGFITDPLVKALYDKMKLFTYYSSDGMRELPFDQLIKSGDVANFADAAMDTYSLSDIYCAKLLCGIAFKIFTWNGNSEHSFDSIERLSASFNGSGRMLTAEDKVSANIRDHLIQKKLHIEQIAGKNGIKLSDIRGVNPKDYELGADGNVHRTLEADRKLHETTYGKSINTNDFILPLPKTESEWVALHDIAKGRVMTRGAMNLINSMARSPNITDKQRKTLRKLLAGRFYEKDISQPIKAMLSYHNAMIELKQQMENGNALVKGVTAEDILKQVRNEMRAADRLNPEQKRIQELGQYVDLDLVIDGHIEDVRSTLLMHPEQAARLRELYLYCNSEDVLRKKLFEAATIKCGSLYLAAHQTSAPRSFVRQEIDEYDHLIKTLNLDRHMNTL